MSIIRKRGLAINDVHAICFDAFGTLCQIGKRYRPFEILFSRLELDPRDTAKFAMIANLGFNDLAKQLGAAKGVERLEEKLEEELASITLFDDVKESLESLASRGFRLWIVSNVTVPYCAVVRRLLSDLVEGFSFSCEVGILKPEPGIFCSCVLGAISQSKRMSDGRR